MNTIELQTTIPVRTFDAPATVAIGRNAPEWLAVVRLAKDLGGTIRANQITAELLGGLPAVVGKRVIDRSVALGLLEQSDPERKEGVARLSKLGEEALNRGQVFVSEDRLWRFYYAEHPLLGQSLLHIEPLDNGSAQSERNELREAKRAGHGRPDDGENTPERLLTEQKTGQVRSSVTDSGPSFVLKEVSETGVHVEGESLRLHLVWKSGEEPELLLAGKLACPVRRRRDNGEPNQPKLDVLEVRRRLTLPPVLSEFTYEQVWVALVALGANLDAATLQDWRRRAGRLVLPVRFSECKPAARNSFRRDLPVPSIPRWRFPDMRWVEGFDPSTLAEVEVVPANEEDAQQWAKWLLHDSLNDYATPERLEGLAAVARQRFPFHSPSLSTPKEMLDEAFAKPTDVKARFSLAPYDLGLWS